MREQDELGSSSLRTGGIEDMDELELCRMVQRWLDL